MFTTIDKALVALVMAVLFVINHYAGIDLGFIGEDSVAAIISVLLPVLTWMVPNKPS